MITTEPTGIVLTDEREADEIGRVATEWEVEGTGRATTIRANCSRCHTVATFHEDVPESGWLLWLPFEHDGCQNLVESIPPEIQEQYLKSVVVSGD